jgi:hypothetical protein
MNGWASRQCGIVRSVALPARFLHEAFDEPLGPLGFARVARRQVWLRAARGVEHAVSLESRSGTCMVRWDVVHPAVGELLHGRRADPSDVRYSGFITGTAQAALRSGVVARFKPTDVVDGSLTAAVASAAEQVAEWTADFATARLVIDYLMQHPGQKLDDPRVVVPVHWPLRLFTAAGLAAVESEPDAQDLAAQAIDALGSGAPPTAERLQRLEDVLA